MPRRQSNIKAIIIGLLVSLIGLFVMVIIGLVAGGIVAHDTTRSGASQEQVLNRVSLFYGSNGFLFIIFMVESFFIVFGGYVTARLVKKSEARYALPVGFFSMLTSYLLLQITPIYPPTWLLPISLLLPVPLALLGVYVSTFELKLLERNYALQWRTRRRIAREREVTYRSAHRMAQQKRLKE